LLLAAGCASRGIAPQQTAMADSADQVMGGMETSITDNNVRVLTLKSDSARVYQQRQVADLEKVTVTFFDKSGNETSTVTSNTGSYAIRDKSLDLRGNVVAVTPSGKKLYTEHLVYDRIANQVRSDTAFKFTAPDGDGSGASFESDPDFKNIITARLRGGMKGKGFVLPGQGAPKAATPAATPKKGAQR
ncbi:MAG: LPS export ABC transporter periplasmic protein LptC, partial [Gemmatimonadales bacterium]